MRKNITIPPPSPLHSFGPSQLFRFFFRLGRWTEESFSDDFQTYTRGKLISPVTINKWKNHDVIPTRYSGALFKLIEDIFDPPHSKDWIAAFEVTWASHIARVEETDAHSVNRERSDNITARHNRWIHSLYEQEIFGETFSTRDLFIPLQLVETEHDEISLYEIDDLLALAAAGTTHKQMGQWGLISGPAGSGKSMLALHLANALAQTDVMPIFLRGQNISDIDIGDDDTNHPIIDSYSARSFLKHFRIGTKQTACIILDGFEDIGAAGRDSAKILSDFRLEQNICSAHGKALNIIVFGRSPKITFKPNPNYPIRQIEILGLDGRLAGTGGTTASLLGKDLRPNWWERYLEASHSKPDATLPDFLSTDYADFVEFGTSPFWSFQLCQMALASQGNSDLPAHEIVNRFTYTMSGNEIYSRLVTQISENISNGCEKTIQPSEAVSVLQHIALAQWKAGFGTPISANQIFATIRDEETRRQFKAMQNQTSTLSFQPCATSETLSYYLIASLILDRFIEIINAIETPGKLNAALETWAAVSSQGKPNPQLADFCQKEASLRYSHSGDKTLDSAKFDAVLRMIKNKLVPAGKATWGIDSVRDLSNSGCLLFFIWSCFNLERYNQTGVQHHFSESHYDFTLRDLKQIQPKHSSEFSPHSLLAHEAVDPSFLTPSLSALHLRSEDLCQLSFGMGHLEFGIFETSRFALTHWSHAKISNTHFMESSFQNAIFHGCRWIKSEFSSCLFHGSNIQNSDILDCQFTDIIFSQCFLDNVSFTSSSFENVIFDRCIFTQCHFTAQDQETSIEGVKFKHCTFLSMEDSKLKFLQTSFESCIFQSETGPLKASRARLT